MNEIQDGRLNRGIGARLNVVEAGPASTLAPEIMPVYIVAPPSDEDRLLRGEFICAASGPKTSIPGFYSGLMLWNPTNSGVIGIVDDLILSSSLIDQVYRWGLRLQPLIPLATPATTGNRDARRARSLQQQNTTLQAFETDELVPLMNTFSKELGRSYSPKGEQYEIGIVVTPGYAFILETIVTNVPFVYSLRWRERRAQPSELI